MLATEAVTRNGHAEPVEPPPRLSRRRFLIGAGGGVLALGGLAYGIDRWTSSPAPLWPPGDVARYRSRTDLLPPVLRTTVPADGTAPGSLFLAPSSGPGQYGPLITDNLGEPIWFHPVSGPWGATASHAGALVATNFNATRYRGRPVLTWWEGVVTDGHGIGRYHVLDDRYRQVAVVEAGNGKRGDLHEFVVTPAGTALLTYYDTTSADLSSVGGPSKGTLLDCGFQEVDIASGDVLFEWSAHRSIGLDESYNPITGQGTSGAPWDFFHINSIDKNADGDYLISARHTWAVYKIDGTTGSVVWRLNGKRSNFDMGPNATFAWQHDARWQPGNSISIFDDGVGTFATELRSRGILLGIDEADSTVSLDEAYVQPGSVVASSQGSVQMLPNGNAFVGWGSAPYLSEFAHDGRLLFSAQLPDHSLSYRAFRFPWVGQPAEPPAATFEHDGSTVTAYASWNGSTEVARWQVLAGRAADSLEVAGGGRRSGFETALPGIRPASGDRLLAVAALDGRGRLLARSEPVPA